MKTAPQPMKSAIFYAVTEKPLTDHYDRVVGLHKGIEYETWIRTVIVWGDCNMALSKAKPRPGEIVLNSIDLP